MSDSVVLVFDEVRTQLPIITANGDRKDYVELTASSVTNTHFTFECPNSSCYVAKRGRYKKHKYKHSTNRQARRYVVKPLCCSNPQVRLPNRFRGFIIHVTPEHTKGCR